ARRELLCELIMRETVGLGPLEELLADPAVEEVMVNGHREVYVERAGRIEHSDVRFPSDQALRDAIERVLAPLGRRGDELSLVSGGTGSGKTTLLNALSTFIDPGERVITIEDAAELRLRQPHVVRLESRPASVEGRGEVTIRDLLRNALRMRPDRIVIGEVRGVEALDLLTALNTGHDGALSTVHANAPA